MLEYALQMLTVCSRREYWEREMLMFAFYSPEFLPHCVMLQANRGFQAKEANPY